jgi:protein-tyrosine kinase
MAEIATSAAARGELELPTFGRPDPKSPRHRPIGEVLCEAGLIDASQVDRVLVHARTRSLRFGEACVSLGLLTMDQLARVLAYQFGLPIIDDPDSAVAPEVIAAHEVAHPVLDDLRALRSELLLRWEREAGSARCSLAVIGTARRQGRSFVAANLAVTLAQLGRRTLLMDADLRSPRQHALFGLPNAQGLSTLLSERSVDRPVIRHVAALPQLAVMPSGPEPPNAVDLLSNGVLPELLGWCEKLFDVVVIDTPAASLGPDARLVAGRSGGSLLVARRLDAGADAVRGLARDVAQDGGRLIGAVLTGHSPAR